MKYLVASVGLLITVVGLVVLLDPDRVMNPLLSATLGLSPIWPATVLIVTGAAMLTIVYLRERPWPPS